MISASLRPSVLRPFVASQPRTQSSRSCAALSVRCEFSEGQKVRVTAPIKVYHVGKFKQGLDLENMEGVVQADARKFKGMELSATLPWKVVFQVPDGDNKPVKVIAHLEDEEIVAV